MGLVAGRIGEYVLVAQRLVDFPENRRIFALEAGEERLAAGLLGESPHLVIGLEKVHALNRTHASTRVDQIAQRLHQADGIDGHTGLLQRLAALVEGHLAEGIDARSDQDDGFAPLDRRHAIGRIGDGIEQVALGEAGDLKAAQRFLRLAPVGREIRQDFGPQVIGHDGHVILRLQGVRKTPRELERLIPGRSPILLEQVAELDDHGDGHGGFAHIDAANLLGHVVLQHAEISGRNAGNEVALVVQHRHVHGDDVHVALEAGQVADVHLVLLQAGGNRGKVRLTGVLAGVRTLGLGDGGARLAHRALLLTDQQSGGRHKQSSAAHHEGSGGSHRRASGVTISKDAPTGAGVAGQLTRGPRPPCFRM